MKVDPIIYKILKKRGITEKEDIEEFLAEKPVKTYDPFLFNDMKAGVDLILSSIEENKKICIFGDYDADGVTSVSILLQVLGELTDNLMYYIPSRFTDGYGLNKNALEKIHSQGAGLVITVDCGSTSGEEIKYAGELGMDILVTDHHNAPEKPADCLFLNPKYKDSGYPFKNLAGCGVAFKLAQAIQRKAGLAKSVITNVLDMVAIGTIGDVVPLDDENRTLVKYGMNVIKRKNRMGLVALMDRTALSVEKISSVNIAFIIAPNLNAAGRIDDASMDVELLTADDGKKAEELANRITECNYKRRSLQDDTFEKCTEIIEKDLINDKILLVEAPDVHEGVAGIVAGKLRDKYKRPVVIIMRSGDLMKGTGRTAGKVDLYETLKICSPIFEKFGGHKTACGFSLKKENIKMMKLMLKSEIERQYEEDDTIFDEEEIIDAVITGKDVTVEMAQNLLLMEPFGCGNPEPVFLFENVKLKDIFYMGERKQHVRFMAESPDGSRAQCVLFNYEDKFASLATEGVFADVTGRITKQEFRGRVSAQVIVKNVNIHE